MAGVIKVIVALLIALAVFLAGWLAHAWKNKGQVEKEVKQAISDLNKEHKKALMALKDDYEEQIRRKDEIINELKNIIDRLINVLQSRNELGESLVEVYVPAANLVKKLNSNLYVLNSL